MSDHSTTATDATRRNDNNNADHRFNIIAEHDDDNDYYNYRSEDLPSAMKFDIEYNIKEIAKKKTFFKKRPGKFSLLVIAALMVACITFVFVCAKLSRRTNVCDNEKCLQIALVLKETMNTSVDPCHDFYGYVCGRWLDLSLQHNWIEERKNRLLLSLPNLINKRQRKSAPSTIRMAQVLYSSCLAVEDQYKLGLQPLFDLLNKLNLPRVPAMIEPEQSSSDQGEDNFVKSMARVRKLLGIDAFFILDVKRDSRDKRKNLLRFAPPNTDTLTKVDRFYMLNVFQRIINNRTSESCDEFDIVPSENITNLVNQIRNLSLVVDELNQKYANKYSLIDQAKEIDDAKYMLLDELQQATDHYVRSVNESIVPRPLWRPLIEELLLEVVDFDPAQQKVYVGDLEYLQEIAYLLSSTEEQLLETTVWWMVVNFCVPHTSKELRDISIKRGKNLPRSTYCSNSLNDLMSMAVAWIVVEPTFARDDSRDRVAEMLDNLKRAFANFVLEDDDRLDEPAKLATLEKIRRLKSIIGFPDSLFQDGQLDKYYDGINLTTNHYFNNLLQIIRSENNKKLLNLAKYNADDDDDFSDWEMDLTKIHAKYNPDQNLIEIPLAFLQFPNYGLGLEALNYGAAGSAIGRELIQVLTDPWGNELNYKLNKTVECFDKQYNENDYLQIDIDHWLAYSAYRIWRSKHGHEQLLPGFSNFTDEQLFFLSYVHQLCEVPSDDEYRGLLEQDSVCSKRVMVRETLRNSEHFNRAFGCPVGSPMNPK